MKVKNKRLMRVAEKFTDLMIKKIAETGDDWKKPWLEIKRKDFLPRNISGRFYSGGNTFMLLLCSMRFDYGTPVFLTFNQAEKMNVRINKGAGSFPVFHIAYMYYDWETKDKITVEKYERLDESLRSDYTLVPTPRCYDVFNLDQTDYSKKYPEEWEELAAKHRLVPELNDGNLFSLDLLDNLIGNQEWVCPINLELSNRAYYSPGEDKIVLPLKSQFDDGKSFYAAALHEMTHSTGSQGRLKRIKAGARKGTVEYAKEELVAELSAALMGYYMGMETHLRADHAAYLRHWLGALREDSGFLMDVLGDVVKAVRYTCRHMGYDPFGQDAGQGVDPVAIAAPAEKRERQTLFAFEELTL